MKQEWGAKSSERQKERSDDVATASTSSDNRYLSLVSLHTPLPKAATIKNSLSISRSSRLWLNNNNSSRCNSHNPSNYRIISSNSLGILKCLSNFLSILMTTHRFHNYHHLWMSIWGCNNNSLLMLVLLTSTHTMWTEAHRKGKGLLCRMCWMGSVSSIGAKSWP